MDLENVLVNEETNRLIVQVFRLNGQLISTADDLVFKFGLTGARWQVLGAIAQAQVPETVSCLARNMGLTRQSVQRIVNEMVAEDMLELSDNPHHKRAKLVTMTRKGEKAFQSALELQGPWVKGLSAGISKKRLVDAIDVLQTIGKRLEEQKE